MKRRGRPLENEIKYPALKAWIEKNCDSISDFSRLLCVNDKGFRSFLYGRNGCTKHTIDLILEVTGMTYEEAFKEEK